MLAHFGWIPWEIQLANIAHLKPKPIERTGLRYLHRPTSLEILARMTLLLIARQKPGPFSIHVESIWIDGTPQAVASCKSGSPVKCELADLLFIVSERSSTNSIIKEKGVLLQGKASGRYNKLEGGGKTTKYERELLEKVNRTLPISLYSGMNAAASGQIGTYLLGGSFFGLADCSRYLIIPKVVPRSSRGGRAPFQIGWPFSERTTYLKSPRSILQSIQEMFSSGGIGKAIIDPSICEWSRMVNDLRGKYTGINMAGYGGQSRISNAYHLSPLGCKISPPPTGVHSESGEGASPHISTITIVIRNEAEDESKDE